MNKQELEAYDAMMSENDKLRAINKKRLDPSLVVTKCEMIDLICILREWADSADDQALKWERARDYGESEREYQRSLQVGKSLGLTAAANALGGWLSDGRPKRWQSQKQESPTQFNQ